MKVLFAIDSFKGCLSSLECGKAAALGLRNAIPDAEAVICPIADGGEGTTDAITMGLGGHFEEVQVTGPLGNKVNAKYGVINTSASNETDNNASEKDNSEKDDSEKDDSEKEATVIIEISAAAGLTLIPEIERDPMKTTTYGVGEMIKHALDKGYRKFIIGLGGSATNDMGIGMLQALGVRFLDENGEEAGRNYLMGGDMEFIRSITDRKLDPRISECSFRVACDVNNPLCGENGATYIFGPQKGLFEAEKPMMDMWMQKLSEVARKDVNPSADPNAPGSGAAGGLGYAFKNFLGAELEPGIKIIIDETGLKSKIKDCDLIITGEGRLDSQTKMGKTPVGIAHIAKTFAKPVVVIAGAVAPELDGEPITDVDAYFPILRRPMDLSTAMDPGITKANITNTCEQIFRIYKRASK